MATIGGDRVIVRSERRGDDSWLFTVCYTAQFTSDEVGARFDDSVQIGLVSCADHDLCGREEPVRFTATGTRVFRKKRIVVRRGCYSTAEDVCAWIRLHAADSATAADEQCTPPLVMANHRPAA